MPLEILIIEDDPVVARSLQAGLSHEGFAVTWKSRGVEGMEYAWKASPHLVLLYIRLPDGSGYDFCRQMRQMGLRQPAIMLTARYEGLDQVLGLEMGADDYVTKPFSLRELVSRVRAQLRRAYGDYAIAESATNEVTHIVIQKGWLLPEDKVVPFSMITSNDERIILKEDIGNFDQLPSLEEKTFVQVADEPGATKSPAYQYTPTYYWYPSPVDIGYAVYTVENLTTTKRNIPDNTIPLKEGTDVISSDGEHVGDVERLFVDPDSNRTTHFLISQGLLFKDHKLVTIDWVTSMEEDKCI